MDAYILIKEIGKGTYGHAMKAHSRRSGATVVLKIVNTRGLSEKERNDAIKEVNVLKRLCHPNIVKLLDSFHSTGSLCIVMEYADNGDLSSRIKAMKLSGSFFGESQICNWLVQLLMGLSYIHANNIIHRDFKPQNLFLASEGNRILIGDYGACKVVSSKQALAHTMMGTPFYMSPEVFQNKPYSFKSDIWALGCVLYELCSLQVPFEASNVQSLSLRVCRGSNPAFPSRYSTELKRMFLDTMQRDHRSRPSADDLLSRSFLRSYLFSSEKPSVSPARTRTSTAASTSRPPLPSPLVRRPASRSFTPPPPSARQVSPRVPAFRSNSPPPRMCYSQHVPVNKSQIPSARNERTRSASPLIKRPVIYPESPSRLRRAWYSPFCCSYSNTAKYISRVRNRWKRRSRGTRNGSPNHRYSTF